MFGFQSAFWMHWKRKCFTLSLSWLLLFHQIKSVSLTDSLQAHNSLGLSSKQSRNRRNLCFPLWEINVCVNAFVMCWIRFLFKCLCRHDLRVNFSPSVNLLPQHAEVKPVCGFLACLLYLRWNVRHTPDPVMLLTHFLSFLFSLSLSIFHFSDMLRSHAYRANRTSALTHCNTGRSARTHPSLNTYHTAPSYLPLATRTFTHICWVAYTVNTSSEYNREKTAFSARICINSVTGSVRFLPRAATFGHCWVFFASSASLIRCIAKSTGCQSPL